MTWACRLILLSDYLISWAPHFWPSYLSDTGESKEVHDDAGHQHDYRLAVPQGVGELVDDGGDHSLHDGELAVETEGEQHEEEEDGPEGRDRHEGHCLGVGDEGQTKSCRYTDSYNLGGRCNKVLTHTSVILRYWCLKVRNNVQGNYRNKRSYAIWPTYWLNL